MCKTRFKKGYCNGFSLKKVNEALGSTQEIDSILPIREEEESLMDEITEEDNFDRYDLAVDNWMRFFRRGKGVKFEHLEREPTVPAAKAPREETVGDVMDLLKSIDEKVNKLVEKVDGIEQRLTSVVDEVMAVKEEVREVKVKEKEKEKEKEKVNEEVEDVTKEEVEDVTKEEVKEKSKVRRPCPEAGQGRITRSKTIPH